MELSENLWDEAIRRKLVYMRERVVEAQGPHPRFPSTMQNVVGRSDCIQLKKSANASQGPGLKRQKMADNIPA